MNLKYIFRNSLFVTLLASLVLVSCKDDIEQVDDLFRPHIQTAEAHTNQIWFSWYKINSAVSYTLELSLNETFTEVFYTTETTTTVHKFTDLPYSTAIYYRLRANASNPVYSSAWVSDNVKTGDRVTKQILKPLNKADIFENEATVYWVIDPENPVDSISVIPLVATIGVESFSRYLTAEEIGQGWAFFDGLNKNTVYVVNVYDTHKPGKYDKPYNTVQFRTAGPPAGAIEVHMGDDLAALISKHNTDPEISPGTTYYLEAGATFNTGGIVISKGIRLIAAPGVRPKITHTGNFSFSGDVSEFYIEGVELYNPSAGNYFVNNASGGATFTIGEFSLVSCLIKGMDRGFIRTQATGVKNFGDMIIDDCIFDNVGDYGGVGGYGFLLMNSIEDFFKSFTVKNSTFYKTCTVNKGIVSLPQTFTGSTNITIDGCTFYDSFFGILIDVQNSTGGTYTVKNCLFGGNLFATRTGMLRVNGGTKQSSNNFYTSEFILGGANYLPTAPVKLDQTGLELFRAPALVDYTLLNTASAAYINRAGDPRWIR